jgi:hypothetical protein
MNAVKIWPPTQADKRIAKLSPRSEDEYQFLRGRDLPAEPLQIVRSGNIATATAGQYALTALLWLVLSALIIAAWTVLFEACALTAPARWGADFCPRPVGQAELLKEELRNRELAAVLAGVKSDLVSRTPCLTPQP